MGRRGSKKGRCRKRNKATADPNNVEPEEVKRAPHSFVFHRGLAGPYVLELVRDFRKVMEPYTASSLKVMKKNSFKDFVAVAGFLHVTHFCMFTRTDLGVYLRIARIPRGPTLSFRVHNYTLARDVISAMKKQYVFSKQFDHHPLVVLNGFSGEGMHIKLLATTFQNMFPSINLIKVDLSQVRRCVLLNYDSSKNLVDFRHFAIKVVPTGISKSVKKIVQSKVPNLSHYQEISQFLTNPTQLSESEAEDDPNSHVVLPQKLASRGNTASSTSAIRVVELGPRLTLELLKVEADLIGGEVLYHSYIEKTEEEVQEIRKRLKTKRQLKEKRKKEQKENIKKKEQERQNMKEKSLAGMKMKFEEKSGDKDSEKSRESYVKSTAIEGDEEEEEDDDAQWYREEVGKDPEPELFTTNASGSTKRKKPFLTPMMKRKKMKKEKSENSEKSDQFRGKNKIDKFRTKNKVMSNIKHKRPKPRNK
ncbi:hypothetical protein R5R35_008429 [Gryllus longicercus]|uniref:Brix domain-containing protein n=1 Tax=Gryllus longicercus TaxID=2509291 RepID=A0AAN9ZB88_9ORTH